MKYQYVLSSFVTENFVEIKNTIESVYSTPLKLELQLRKIFRSLKLENFLISDTLQLIDEDQIKIFVEQLESFNFSASLSLVSVKSLKDLRKKYSNFETFYEMSQDRRLKEFTKHNNDAHNFMMDLFDFYRDTRLSFTVSKVVSDREILLVMEKKRK